LLGGRLGRPIVESQAVAKRSTLVRRGPLLVPMCDRREVSKGDGRVSIRSSLAVGLALVAALFVSGHVPAVAGSGQRESRPFHVMGLRAISRPTPFSGGCPDADFDDAHIAGYETEPSITVNPANPRTIIASWMQDVGPEVAARSDLVASSRDRGRTWARSTIPGLTACTGGMADAAGDPWVSAGPDGTVYFVGLGAALTGESKIVRILASHSTNGGRAWAGRATVAARDRRNDKPAITADPVVPGRAYAIWSDWDTQFSFPFANLLRFGRTDDKGSTWSDSIVVDAPPPNAIDIPSVVLVLPDGALVAVFGRISVFPSTPAIEEYWAARSLDGGHTWRSPVEIGSLPLVPYSDPETGEPLPQPGFLSAAAGPDGHVYVSWEHPSSPSSGAIDVARSPDGGRTWSVSSLPGVRSYAFEPSIAVNEHGTVGITWYDLRNDRSGDDALTADVWFANSDDAGASWRQTHVAGPTDLRTAPLAAHNRVGEYQGLAALPSGFAAIFTLAAPLAKDGPTDIFFARMKPTR
jgi:hypothetical protein